jgi:hypothetical protein
MRLRREVLLNVIWLVLFGCNHIKDVQPEDKDIVPSSAVQAIQKSYPKARDFTFETLIKGEIWVADFSVDNARLRTQVNDSAIVSSIYERLPDDFVKFESMTDKLSIRGGEFSELLRYAGDTSTTRMMRYKWKGNTYLMQYQKEPILFNTDEISLTSPNASLPCYVTQDQLPQKIKQFFENNNVNLKFRFGEFSVTPTGAKSYRVYALDYDWPIFFDDDGDLVWTLATNNSASNIYKVPNSELGYPALLAKTEPMYADFNVPDRSASKTNYSGIVSLRFTFQKHTGQQINPDGSVNRDFVNELGEVYFNANTGDLISDWYRGFINIE